MWCIFMRTDYSDTLSGIDRAWAIPGQIRPDQGPKEGDYIGSEEPSYVAGCRVCSLFCLLSCSLSWIHLFIFGGGGARKGKPEDWHQNPQMGLNPHYRVVTQQFTAVSPQSFGLFWFGWKQRSGKTQPLSLYSSPHQQHQEVRDDKGRKEKQVNESCTCHAMSPPENGDCE